jgi:serine/threonine protein kinase
MVQVASGSIIAGKYRLERPLARGGMGAVWVGKHIELDSNVALKFMAPEYGTRPELRARFEREAKASALMKVANVVHVYDYGIEDDTPYLVMELLHGEDLATRLAREGRLSPAAMVRIVDQVCKGLRRAHEVGLIHRDLKPPNIFLTREGEEEIVKILDFGIAKSTAPGLVGKATKPGTLVGSPHYMSPEQVRENQELDHRSDLWSVGIIIFQCLTGRLPFPGHEVGDVLVDICTEDIPVASQIVPDLAPEVDRFLEHALMRERDERFQSARELAEAFAAIVGRVSHADTGSTRLTNAHTLPWMPKSSSTGAGLMIAVVVGAMMLGLGMAALVFGLALRSDAPAATASVAAAPPSSGAPESAPPVAIPSAMSSAIPSAIPSAVLVSLSASMSAPRPSPPPPRGKPRPSKPKKPTDDPLNSR